MGRVLKIGAVVMGVISILMTGLMYQSRLNQAPPHPIIIRQVDHTSPVNYSGQTPARLTLALPGLHQSRPLTPYRNDGTLIGISPDREWVYWWTRNPPIPHAMNTFDFGTLWRIHSGSGDAQVILESAKSDSIVFTSDMQWIVYPHVLRDVGPNHSTIVALFRVRADGSDALNLTEALGYYYISSEPPLIYGEMVLFEAHASSSANIFRVGLHGGKAESLTGRLPTMDIRQALPNSNWVLVALNRVLHQLSYESRELIPLPDLYWLEVVSYIPAARLFILKAMGDERWAGLRAGETTPIWTLDSSVYEVMPDDEWLILRTANGLERMRVDGTERAFLTSVGFMSANSITPDGEWLFYLEPHPTAGLLLKRVRLADGYVETVRVLNQEGVKFAGWSPDGKKLLLQFVHPTPVQTNWDLFMLDTDGQNFEYVTTLGPYDAVVGWGAMPDRQWQPELVFSIGVILGGARVMKNSIGRWRQITQKRLSPAK